jgi:UDPglucose 6-dehydrogenase
MHVTIIGTGYVGLVTGACFAELGHDVTCVDINTKKIEDLRKGIIHIYEPGLDQLVQPNQKNNRLSFSSALPDNEHPSDVYFIAVGTPEDEQGAADVSQVFDAAKVIGSHITKYTVVINKSTVPVGTAEHVDEIIRERLKERKLDIEFDVVSNPEFLREGSAVTDFMKADRVVIGSHSQRAREIMQRLYQPIVASPSQIIFMGVRDAEMTKYAANCMLAMKISFINEIANLCDRLGVDVENVKRGIAMDRRIGPYFIQPGIGYGGSCFPKDVNALISTAQASGYDPFLLKSVVLRNNSQKKVIFKKVTQRYGKDLSGRIFAIWGLAFKPGTDDMREAPSIALIRALMDAGAVCRAVDPVAGETAKACFTSGNKIPARLQIGEDPYQALKDADALILVTEWDIFKSPDFQKMKKMMKSSVIFDGRNLYDPEDVKHAGFEYCGIGRR